MISGATQTGKSYFTKRLLENDMFTTPPSKIIYAYSEYQPLFDKMKKGIIFHEGLPTKEDIEKYADGGHVILVLDDLMLKIVQSEDCVHLFTVTSHHKNVTCIFITQNLYPPGKFARSISLNCSYFVLFRNYRDSRQIITFGSQIFPGQSAYFKDAYDKATLQNFGYLIIDLCPSTDKLYQLRTHIFPKEHPTIYLPKDG